MVETLGTGDDDPFTGHPVQLDRLSLLRVVPHGHGVRHGAYERLARQVVPAPHAEDGSEPGGLRFPEIVDFGRPEADERRQQHHVRALSLQVPAHFCSCRGRPFQSAQRRGHQPRREPTPHPGHPEQPLQSLGRSLPRAASQPGGVGVRRLQIAQTVRGQANLDDQLLGHRVAAHRRTPGGQRRVSGCQARDEVRPAELIGLETGEVDVVTGPGKGLNHLLEVSEAPEVPGDEQDSHRLRFR